MAVDPQPAANSESCPFDPARSARTAANYLRSETSEWLASQAAAFWESLDETWKQGFLAASVSDLDVFSRGFLEVPWLGDFLWRAIIYFNLHGTWDVYVCPKPGCIRFFKEDHSLIAHLKNEHIPDIHEVNAWPFRQKDTAEECWCSDALRRMVWKPIDMDGALDLLSTMCLDGDCATMADIFDGHDLLFSLKWPFSDDPTRSKLLARLGEGFQSLLAEQERSGFSLLSNGHFTMLTALASKHVLIYMPPRSNVLFLGNLLAHSPLSFCFLDESSLSLFVELVSKMCHLVIQAAESFLHEESSNFDSNWNGGETLDAISYSPDNNFFALDHTKADKRGLPALLSNAPCCPLIAEVPSKAVQTFCEIEMKLRLFRDRLHDFDMQLPGFTDRIRSTGIICSSGCCRGCQLKYEMLQFLPKVWYPELSPVQVNLLKEKLRAGFRFQPLCSSCPSITDSLKEDWIACFSEIESCYLGVVFLACELQCLEQQVRRICALDLRMYILPLMKSFLRMRLYLNLKSCDIKLPDEKETSVVNEDSEFEDNSESEDDFEYEDDCEFEEDSEYDDDSISAKYLASDTDLESEASEVYYDSDTYSVFKTDLKPKTNFRDELKLQDKPWMKNSILRSLDSTFRENTAWAAKDTSLYFCMEVSDIQRHCAQTCLGDAHRSLWKGMEWFRLNKTWKYWYCYGCDKIFQDQESHMVHMEFEHQICLLHDEYWLIPVPLRQDVVESEQYQLQHGPLHDEYSLIPRSVKQDDLNSNLGLEDTITVDHSCTYFLVDSSKFSQMPSTKEVEKFGCDNHKIFNKIVQLLQNQLSHLRCLFSVKRKLLRSLEALCALSCVLLNGNHPLRHLISLLDKFFSLDLHTDTSSLFQISLRRLSQSHATLSNQSIEEACGTIEDDLLSKLDDLDHEILEILAERRKLNGLLYDLCVCDYRTNILPHVKSFIHAKFALDEDLQSLVCTTIEGLLSSIGAPYVFESESFSAVPLSLGKVLINMNGEESGLGFAYLGICLRFDGQCLQLGNTKVGGDLQFAGLSNWEKNSDGSSFLAQGKVSFNYNDGTYFEEDDDGVTPNYMKASREESIESLLYSTIMNKLFMFEQKYVKKFVRYLR